MCGRSRIICDIPAEFVFDRLPMPFEVGKPFVITVDDQICRVKNSSNQLSRMLAKTPYCVGCGLVLSIVKLLTPRKLSRNWFFFQYYGVNEGGEHILLTKDHIIPSSRGGLTEYHNLQVLCAVCNNAKADNLPDVVGAT